MSEKLNLFQRINKVRESIGYVQKDKQVQNYKAVTHDQVTSIIRQHLIDNGIIIYPNLISSVTVDSGDKTSKGTSILRNEVVYEFTVVNADDAADNFKTSISAHANDTGDKAPGKALSYAKKSLVLKLFEIETGEDEESRYQEKEVFNLEFYTELLKESKTIKELEVNYLEAKNAATKFNDRSGFKAINALTSNLKAELAKVENNA